MNNLENLNINELKEVATKINVDKTKARKREDLIKQIELTLRNLDEEIKKIYKNKGKEISIFEILNIIIGSKNYVRFLVHIKDISFEVYMLLKNFFELFEKDFDEN